MPTSRKNKALFALAICAVAGCRSAGDWRKDADDAAARRIASAQSAAGAVEEDIVVETAADTLRRRLLVEQKLPIFDPASLGIRDLPTNLYWNASERMLPGGRGGDSAFSPKGTNALEIGLHDAVRIAAANSPEFREAKEALFATALALDLESRTFHGTLLGAIGGSATTARENGRTESSHGSEASAGVSKTFENGVETDASFALNLAGMLTGERRTAWGAVADAGFSIPLLRGSGSLVRRESLTQAERDLVYAVRAFEQKKREFAVEIERSYLSLLLAMRTRLNEDENYRRVMLSTQRSRRMADANRMSKTAFDQSHQSELSARAGWIAACRSYDSALDAFKTRLGLPPDSKVVPKAGDIRDLKALVERFLAEESGRSGGSDLPERESVDDGEMKEYAAKALGTAFANNPVIATARDRVEDAQRHLVVAEDGLRAEMTLGAKAGVGHAATATTNETGGRHSNFRMDNPSATVGLTIDPALERTSERNSYRNALIAVESAVRDYQKAEDDLKSAIREDVRALFQTREALRIQSSAVELAARRVRNQDLLMEAGRADMKDLLDAQAALLSAQNSLYRAITDHRAQQLALQRDMGTLDVTADGVWSEPESPVPGVALRRGGGEKSGRTEGDEA